MLTADVIAADHGWPSPAKEPAVREIYQRMFGAPGLA
jgi:hypothetical protein